MPNEAPVVFAAMLCRDDGGNGWAAIGQILETRGADCVPTWLGNHGEVRCCWLHNEPNEPHSMRYVKTEDAAADAVWYPAALFLRKVAMLARRDGSFTLAAPDANAIINSVWAYNLGHFREGHVKEVGGGGELQGSRPMLSRMLRDAVHLALHDDRVKRGSARVDSVPRSDFVALMASKRQYKKNAKNERQLLYAFSDVRQLDSVLGGHGWEAVYQGRRDKHCRDERSWSLWKEAGQKTCASVLLRKEARNARLAWVRTRPDLLRF
jgi:hypothetical protein